jgi:hypothetical protein
MCCKRNVINFNVLTNFSSLTLRLSFDSKELRMVCENSELAINKYGVEVANKLQDRLSDILAANNLADIVVGNPKPIVIDAESFFRFTLVGNVFLNVKCGHVNPPLNSEKQIDWPNVSYVKIISIQ